MNPTCWNRAKEIAMEAMSLDSGARESHVQGACGVDAELLETTRRFLSSSMSDSFMATPRVRGARDLFEEFVPAALVGEKVAAYRLTRFIASGGMGMVFEAEVDRTSSDHRRVAVKILRSSLAENAARRFSLERKLLAHLDHPHITRFIDGGVWGGMAYLVMEYIEGVPINEYGRVNGLTIEARIRLVISVCRAVEFAHRNLVVHRDLKPNNIIVTNEGVPKLLDFGVAKLLDEAVPESSRHMTSTMAPALTPAYASPEQVKGQTITTATDVYSLSMIIYELLTGRLPYDLSGLGQYEKCRIICEAEPAAPSHAWGQVRRAGHKDEERPADNSRFVRKRLKGDIDNIILKGLEKSPSRRYADVVQLRQDLEAHLAGHPVSACNNSLRYRTGKFIRRRWRSTALVTLSLLTILIGSISTQFSLARVKRERAATETAKAETEAVNDFLGWLISSTSPFRTDPLSNTMGLLDKAGKRVGEEFVDQPSVEGVVRYRIARTYQDLWRWSDAIPHLQRALELFQGIHGKTSRSAAVCETALSRSLAIAMRSDAVLHAERALTTLESISERDEKAVASAKAALGFALFRLRGRETWARAKELTSDAALSYQKTGETHWAAANRFVLAQIQDREGNDLELTERLYRQTADELVDGNDRFYAACLTYLAQLQRRMHKFEQERATLWELVEANPGGYADGILVQALWRVAVLESVYGKKENLIPLYQRALLEELTQNTWSSDQSERNLRSAVENAGTVEQLTQATLLVIEHLTQKPGITSNALVMSLVHIAQISELSLVSEDFDQGAAIVDRALEHLEAADSSWVRYNRICVIGRWWNTLRLHGDLKHAGLWLTQHKSELCADGALTHCSPGTCPCTHVDFPSFGLDMADLCSAKRD